MVSLAVSQYLTFILDGELFAIDISGVREVLDFTKVTRVPCMPDFMMGVINLRGSVVPVIDMKKKFGMSPVEKTVNTCIIIIEIYLDGENIILGVLADSVQEVFELGEKDINEPPKIGTGFNGEFMKGMGKKGDDFVIILDINRIFSAGELTAIKSDNKEYK